MLINEAHATQEVLFVCDMLDAERQPVNVMSVWKRLITETTYEYPHDLIAKIIKERDTYVFNVKTHGFEKERGCTIELIQCDTTVREEEEAE